MDYTDECRFGISKYLNSVAMSMENLPEELIDPILHRFYKNYYSYDMDEDLAAQAAISEALVANNMTLDGFEIWVP
ncbi:MAG: hypothetical protein IJT80_07870 [Lachnospiraceae bacterium]|nr:hypothetical protein [Lachnospiraceae bacterium]